MHTIRKKALGEAPSRSHGRATVSAKDRSCVGLPAVARNGWLSRLVT